ncbi:uncharacterized protein LOC121504163 [Xyrichtys novacula]|uniref:Uncharacterized protein LOC121504163 n=1 Tax=Xyrichtys novacula TaxID=13765 RepID=A0AAV1HKS1_XYRNO|nr:uncharacterized protein LOC121504163 [Xyrichtys novacula]
MEAEGDTNGLVPGGNSSDSNPTKVNGSEASQGVTSTSPPLQSQTTGAHDGGKIELSTTTRSSSTSPSGGQKPSTVSSTTDKEVSSTWVYVTLVLIILVIIVLCIILYLLRRVSRSYSFDLQRPVTTNHLNEPAGTFEQVYVDDLDRSDPKDQVILDDLSPTPVANGTAVQSEEKSSNGDNGSESCAAPQEEPDELYEGTSPASPTLGDEQADNHSTNSINLFFDMAGEEQLNGNNNNNPSVCSSDPFVEINLDDPALCDQLLTSPGASSSVLPFSPFSLSSSS